MAIFGRSKSGKNTDDKTKAGSLGGFGLDISPEALAERFDINPDNVPEFMEWHKQFVTQHGRQPLDAELEDQANSLRKLNELAHEGKEGRGVGTPTGMLLTIYDKYIQSVMGVIASAQQSGSIAPAQIQASEQISHEARELNDLLSGTDEASSVGEKKDPKDDPISPSFIDESIDKLAQKYEEFASASGLDDLRSYWQTTNKNPGILELRKQIAHEQPEAKAVIGSQASLDAVLSSYREYTDAVQGAVDQLRQKGSPTLGIEDKLDDISDAIKDVRSAMAGHGTFISESPDEASAMTATTFQDINDSIDTLRTVYTSLKNDTQIDQFENILGDEQNLAYNRTNILTDLKMGSSPTASAGPGTPQATKNDVPSVGQTTPEEEIEFRVPHGSGSAAASQPVVNVSSSQNSSQSASSSSNHVTTAPSVMSNDGAVTHMQAQANAAAEVNSYHGQRREGIRATLGQAAEEQYVGWYRQQIASGHTPTTGEVNAYIGQLNTRFGLGGVVPHAVSQPGVWGQGATDLSAQNAQVEARGNNIGRDYGAEAQGEFSDWFWGFVRQNGRQPTYGEVDAATDRIISGRTYLPDAPQTNSSPNSAGGQAPAYDSESAVQRLSLQLANEHGPAAANALNTWYRQQSSDGTPPTFAQMQAQRRAIDAMFTASDRPASAPAPFSAGDLNNLVNGDAAYSGSSSTQVPYGVPLTQTDIDNFAELYPNSILPSVGDVLADPSAVEEPAGGAWDSGYNPTAAWQGEMEDKRRMRQIREQSRPATGAGPVRPAGTGGFFESAEAQENAQAEARRQQAAAAAQNATEGVGQDGEVMGQQSFGPNFSMSEHADNVQARLETEAQAALQDFLDNAPPGSDPSILNEHFNSGSGAGSQFNVNFSPDGNITVVPKNGTQAQSALMEAAFDDLRANDNPYAGGVGSRGAPGAAAAAAARRRRAEELLTAGFEHDQQAMAEAAEQTSRRNTMNISDSNTLASMAAASAMPAYNPDTMSDAVQQSYLDQAEEYGINVNNLDDYDRWVANFISSNGRQPSRSEQEAQLDKIRALESAAGSGPVRPAGVGGFFQSQEAQENAQYERSRQAKNMENAFDELRDSGNPYVGGVSFGRPGGAGATVPRVNLTDEQAETLGTADYNGSIAPGTVVTTDDGEFLIDENGAIQSTDGMSTARIRELNRYLAGGGTWAEYFEEHSADELYGASGGGGTRVRLAGIDDIVSPDGLMNKDTFQKGVDEDKDQEKLLGSATLADKYDQWVAQFTARNRRPPSSRERSEFLNRTAQMSPMSLAAAVATAGTGTGATVAPQNAAYNASTGATSTGIVSTGLGVSQPASGSLKTPGIEIASAAGRQTLKGLDGQMGAVTAPASGFSLKNSSTGMGVANVPSPAPSSAPFVKPVAPTSSATIRNQQTSTIKSEVTSPYRPQNDATVLHISRQTTSASSGSKTMDSLKSSVSGTVSGGVTSGVKTSQTLNGAISGGMTSGITSGAKTALPIKPTAMGGITGGISSGVKTATPIKSAVSGGVTSGIKTPVINPAATPTKTIPVIKPTASAPVLPKTVASTPKTVAAAPKVAAPAPAPTTTTVKAGDGWYALASKNGTTVDALLRANGATLNTVIHPGQSIKVPAKTPAAAGGVVSGVTGTKTASPSLAKTPAAATNKSYSPVKTNASKVTNSYTPPKSASKTMSSIPGSTTPKKSSNIAPKAF